MYYVVEVSTNLIKKNVPCAQFPILLRSVESAPQGAHQNAYPRHGEMRSTGCVLKDSCARPYSYSAQ